MSEIFNSYLQTYPRTLEEHTDSSDFEDVVDTNGNFVDVTRIKKKKLLLNKQLLRKVKLQHGYCSSHEHFDENGRRQKSLLGKKIQVPDKRHRINNIESESAERLDKSYQKNNVVANYSTSEIHLRNKALKCSNYTKKHLSSIEEKHITIDHKDNACQVYGVRYNNADVRFKKRRQKEFDQPVHELNCEKDVHYNTTEVVNYSWPRHILNSIKESETSTNETFPIESSISREIDNVTLEDKSYIDYNQYNNILRYGMEKNPKNMSDANYKKKKKYHVYSAPQNANIGVSTSFNSETPKSEVTPARSSVFWDYVANKIQLKTRREGNTCSRPCVCSKEFSMKESSYPYDDNEISRKRKYKNHVKCECSKPRNKNRKHPLEQYEQPRIPNLYEESLDTNSKLSDETIQNEIPCQRDHDTVTAALRQKYNGEILCIHNPPCILVNGCLKIPPRNETSPTWFVTQETKPSFCQHDNKQNPHLKNHQTDSKYINILEYYSEEDRIEREIQSGCQHQPPCKFVRQCLRPKNSPKLDHCCVHVPMCRKIPQCILETDDYNHSSCDHKPRCIDLPICAKEYLLQGELTNVESEVKESINLVCYHKPQCIIIPRCLARMMCDGSMPYNAIPDCTHEPPCERIPACYRRSPKMVSTYSQYPSPCRIV